MAEHADSGPCVGGRSRWCSAALPFVWGLAGSPGRGPLSGMVQWGLPCRAGHACLAMPHMRMAQHTDKSARVCVPAFACAALLVISED